MRKWPIAVGSYILKRIIIKSAIKKIKIHLKKFKYPPKNPKKNPNFVGEIFVIILGFLVSFMGDFNRVSGCITHELIH